MILRSFWFFNSYFLFFYFLFFRIEGETPRIGPAAPAFVEPTPVEQPTSTYISGATFSAAPQPNQSTLPYTNYTQNYGQTNSPVVQYSAESYIPTIPIALPIAGLPARPSTLVIGEGVQPVPTLTTPATFVRPAEESPDDEPGAKRQRVIKKMDGSYWPEEEWIAAHPVSNFISKTLYFELMNVYFIRINRNLLQFDYNFQIIQKSLLGAVMEQ